MGKRNTFKDLEAHWYQKLANRGFEDIEDIKDPNRRLIYWHSLRFCNEDALLRQRKIEKYTIRLDSLINHEALPEICIAICKHGNSILTPNKVRMIIEYHAGGDTEREIAEKMKCSKKCIHVVIFKVREWMKIL